MTFHEMSCKTKAQRAFLTTLQGLLLAKSAEDEQTFSARSGLVTQLALAVVGLFRCWRAHTVLAIHNPLSINLNGRSSKIDVVGILASIGIIFGWCRRLEAQIWFISAAWGMLRTLETHCRHL